MFFVMQHQNIPTNASAEQKTALAKSLIEHNLADKGSALKSRQENSFRFADGDVVTIASGFAQPIKTTVNGNEIEYLGFPATVKHTNGVTEQVVISLRQLTSPTILLSEKSTCRRADLAYRFGRQTMAFEDVTVDKEVVTLPKLERNLSFKISIADKVWMPDYETYDEGTREYNVIAEPRVNYGYVKA